MLGVNPRFDFIASVPADVADPDAPGRVHLVAIGGAGMSAVARLLLERGVAVSGSDAKDSPALADLAERGAEVHVGHDPAHVDGARALVISSAIPETNVEVVAARDRGIPVLHRAQALAACTAGRRVLAVAGANGKTTTSSLLTVALTAAGAEPSFALGGELRAEGTNARLRDGEAFVVEADESDGSFLCYRPEVAVVTNVQPDHLDFYGDLAHVDAAYRDFVRTIRPGGMLVACADDAGSAALARAVRSGEGPGAGARVITYGTAPEADVHIADIDLGPKGSRAVLVVRADGVEQTHELVLTVPGEHNVRNAAAAWAAAVLGVGADGDGVLRGLAEFGGTRRRFERRGVVDGIAVVDDYAHNVGKVEAVVRTAKDIVGPDHRLVVVFQPHLFSRTRDFAPGFADALAPADEVVLLPVYGAREEPVEGVGPELIAAPLRDGGRSVHVLEDEEVPAWAAAQRAAGRLGAGDLLMTVGAGDVTRLGPLILTALEDARP